MLIRKSEEIRRRLSDIGEAVGGIACRYIIGIEEQNEQLRQQNLNLKAMLEFQREIGVDTVFPQEICKFENRNDKIKKFCIEALNSWDCRACREIGIDSGSCSGNCEDVILDFLEVER